MKLRNKETGGLANMLGEQDFIRVYTDAGWKDYHSLAELTEEWEDYAPTEPLIKDEKIRKAVRAWAEVNEVESVFITVVKDAEEGYLYWELASIEWEQSITIRFGGELPDPLENMGTYTIEELCGRSTEEEDNER